MKALNRDLPKTGSLVPDVSLSTLDGGTVNLRAFAGKKLILFMWASW
jgi:peroxiredoxin